MSQDNKIEDNNQDINPSNIYSGVWNTFDVGIAQHLGVNAAIIFNHILYWLRINVTKKNCDLSDGLVWMYETQEEIASGFGYMSPDEVFRCIKKLVDSGLLIKSKQKKNPFDQTNKYTVYDQKLITEGTRVSKKVMQTAPVRNGSHKGAGSDSARVRDDPLYIAIEQQKEQQQGAAAFSEKEEQQPSVEENLRLLEKIDIPEGEKVKLASSYSKTQIEHAISFYNAKKTISPTYTPDTSWCALLRASINENWAIPIPKSNIIEENKKYAQKLYDHIKEKNLTSLTAYYQVLSDSVEISFAGCTNARYINFDDHAFKEKLYKIITENFKKKE